jgi:hypothetical protein
MRCALAIEKLYHDLHLIEVGVTAWNGVFGGTAALYLNHDELEAAANSLRSFPVSFADRREVSLGTFDLNSAGGGAHLTFFCMDLANHTQLEITLQTDEGSGRPAQRVAMFANFDPASLDRFILQLIALSRDLHGAAVLEFSEPVNRA